MNRYNNASELAKDMGVKVDDLKKTYDEYNKAAVEKKD